MTAPQTKETLRFAKYTRFGVWVALVSGLSIGLIGLFERVPFLHIHLVGGVGLFSLFGVVLLLASLRRYRPEQTAEELLRFFQDPHYWGLVLVVTGGIVYALCPPYRGAEPPPPPPLPLAATAKAAPVIPQPEVVKWPTLRVSGVIVHGSRSSATINGQTVWLGESVAGVKIVNVSESRIGVEYKGVRKEIRCSFN